MDNQQYGQGVEVTVTIGALNGTPGTITYAQRVSHEFAIDADLETPHIEEAAVHAVRQIAGQVLGEARHEKRERERLEAMLGGPATPARMAGHLSKLLNRQRATPTAPVVTGRNSNP